MMEFHVSRDARRRYQFAESLFSYTGNVVFANMAACREFTHRMNLVREVEKHPERAVHAGQLYAMGLIDEASHALMARYREQFDPEVFTSALDFFSAQVGAEALDKLLLTFVEHFPGASVIRGEQTPRQWLAATTEGTPNRAAALEELLLLWTANRNEAFRPFEELFEDKTLAEKTVYRQVTQQLPDYFATRPLIPVPNAQPLSLLDLLRAPALRSPGSLSDQLALIRRLWRPLLGDSLERLLLLAGEILREEELAIWTQFNPPGAQAEAAARHRQQTGQQQWPSIVSTAEVPVFGDPAHEYERFTADTAWMPNTVLIAKSTYVWLAQLSKQYGRSIKRLDEIPNEELATLARRGLNSLWLIGVWERSRASKTIKLLCGNQDAVASAYSLFDYRIAEDLGGESAYINLRDRCYRHGVRLASDMVPNHMGIDSPWVIEHPEWFISRNESPYPAYSFNGPDLSHDSRVEIKIEDHYFEQSDAAVVFRRRDRASGETRFIYHGNDGTSFPWNDTAQLDYLNPAVREQVIRTILHVARLFPVIRFDAAMTLAKRHFHRLWFPGPGASGAIPSRAEYGMSQAEFDRHMPHEFWREVVDRVAAEVPGTLLLAEAFWLMEGYFVRTLGMHRVYNSAFMVMLRDEDNAKYRSVIKNTLEFDPDIMKRYVNFMSNPDERTAIDQFGNGDKCFGVAALMATLPGLPMFGHGQIEGFTEKYGMEYQRPRYDETADHWLVERHQREIAPLLYRRSLFAESSNFLLYDFYEASGSVDENVFAYSNRNGSERALVVYNNRYGQTHGTIDNSAAYADKGAAQLRQQRLHQGLGLSGDNSAILAFRDSLTGLEYVRRAGTLSNCGLTLDLHAYQCHVFLEWRELHSTAAHPWDRLCDQLSGAGVPNLDDALISLELRPVHDALRQQLRPDLVRLFADLAEHPRTLASGPDKTIELARGQFYEQAWQCCESFLRVAQSAYVSRSGHANSAFFTNPALLGPAFRERLRAAMRIPAIEALFPAPWPAAARRVLPSPSPQFTATAMWGPVLAWPVLELLAESIDADHPEHVALDLFDRLRLREPFAQSFAALGFDGEAGWRVAARIKVVLLTGAGIGREEPSVLLSEPQPAPVVSQAAEKPDSVPASPATEKSNSIPAAPLAEEPYSVPTSPLAEERDSNPALYQGTTLVVPQSLQNKRGALAPEGSSSGALPESEPASADKQNPGIPPALWSDPDVRWLTGAHHAEGHDYFRREPYEELLWWLLLPSLLRIAADATPARTAIAHMTATIQEALSAAQAAKYRIDVLIAPPPAPPASLREEPISKRTAAPTASEIQSEAVDPAQQLIDAEPPPPPEPKPSTTEHRDLKSEP
jgi:glycosidase